MVDRPRLIALTGHAGAGKDTAASFLVSAAGYQAIAFADALRAEIVEAWRIDVRMLQDPATKEIPLPALAAGNCGDPGFVRYVQGGVTGGRYMVAPPRSPRWVMQQWGDFQKRRHGDAYYADIVVRWLLRQAGTGWRRLVVTDLRFPHEEAALRSLAPEFDVRVVRVHRPQLAHAVPAMAADTAAHDSNRIERIRADVDITNEGTLAALAEQVLELAGAQP